MPRVIAAALLALALPAAAAEVVVPRVARPPVLEDFLAMEPAADLASSMAKVEGPFLQRIPRDGEPSSRRTDVWLGYDAENLYVVFAAFDEPARVRARLNRREDVFGDDIVQIMVDTFHDRRRAYSFICNPLGVQFDAIYTETQEFDDSFDTVWASRGRLTDRGFVVWMAIPFRSLRFPAAGEQVWGVLFNRDIPSADEETFWPLYTSRIQGRLNQMGTLRGLRDISPGRNVQFIPYAAARRFRALEPDAAGGPAFVRDPADVDGGLDAKFVFNDGVVLDATLNPDFSQVESDAPQITVNRRFEVFFPEKRPFFLENGPTFKTPIDLVFTRRIADPRLGARLTGKAGPWLVGALAMDDEAPGEAAPPGDPLHGERARIGIVRVARDVGRQSSIGVLATGRDLGGSTNVVGGADARLKWSDNWFSDLQLVTSRTRDAGGSVVSDEAFDASVEREGLHFFTTARWTDVGRDFSTELGFVPRTDIRDRRIDAGWVFRPAGKLLLAWSPELFVQRIDDHDGLRLDRATRLGLEVDLARQTHVEGWLSGSRERVRPVDFPVLTAPEDIDTSRVELSASTEPSGTWGAEIYWAWGRDGNFVPAAGKPPSPARFVQGESGATLRLGRGVRLQLTALYTRLTDRAGAGEILASRIVRAQLRWQVDTRLSFRTIVQHDALAANPALTSLAPHRRLNADFLASYVVNPWTAIYAGWNSNWRDIELLDGPGGREIVRAPGERLNDARQVFVKVSYLIRP